MADKKNIVIIGAGIIGLSTALWLQKAGHQVTIIDKQEPGEGASFGNAGVLASFARLPFTRFSMLGKIPKLLLDKNSPLSISRQYIPEMCPYAWHYFRSCFHYPKSRHALTELQSKAFESDQVLFSMTGGNSFIRSEGSLALLADPNSIEIIRSGEMLERKAQGVNYSLVSADQVREMEPCLAPFYAGGVYYPDTRHTVSPIKLSRCYKEYFLNNGGVIIQDIVQTIQTSEHGVKIQLSDSYQCFEHLVIAAGSASKSLVKKLNFNIPLVSERGYHLMIDSKLSTSLQCPIAWLDKSVFLSPIENQIRLAGTAEFADIDSPASKSRIENLKNVAKTMLGNDFDVKSTWLGSRPSTPDSLPIIGGLESQPKVTLAFGHGHLGLTLSAVTGRLVCEIIEGKPPCVDLSAFSPDRFNLLKN